jgi:hypothetical protein
MVGRGRADGGRGADLAASRAVARFERRVRAGLFLSGLADGALAGAAAYAAAVLVARLLGRPFDPAAWAPLAAVPALALGVVRVVRAGRSPSGADRHLDRRLGLSGLLLAARERGAGEWDRTLEKGLASAATALPRPRWTRLLARLAPAAALVAAVIALPAPAPPAASSNPLLAEALDRFAERLELLAENRVVPPEQAADLEQRSKEVEARAARGERVEWADVDALGERLEGARATSVASLARAADAAGALAGRGDAAPAGAKADAEALEEVRAALAKAQAAGLDGAFAKEWSERLASAGGKSGAAAASGAGSIDAADLEKLAAALGEAAGDRLDGLEAAGVLSEGEALDLRELVEATKSAFREGEAGT